MSINYTPDLHCRRIRWESHILSGLVRRETRNELLKNKKQWPRPHGLDTTVKYENKKYEHQRRTGSVSIKRLSQH